MPKIQFKRGLKTNLPVLNEGEPGFTTDTEEFFIGSKDGNIEFAKQADLDTTNANVETNSSLLASYVHTDANAELVNARGTYSILGDRLNNTDEQLADIVTVIKPSSNDRQNINNLIANGGKFLIKKGTYNIDDTGIQTKSNTILMFEQGAILQKTTTNSDTYYVINIDSVDNVLIINPQIIGDRDTHTGTTGEWGHGINILNSNNVSIIEPNIQKCWGDGIYIGINYGTVNSKLTDNIKIIRPRIDNCRRNGISACCGKSIIIENPYITNINGTAPQAGIDIEPESTANTPYLNFLRIINPFTENCNLGINAILANLNGQQTDILIEGHHDNGSANAFTCGNATVTLTGSFIYNDAILENAGQRGITINQYGVNMPHLRIINPTIINSNTQNGSTYDVASAIYNYEPSATTNIGNVTIEGLTVIDTRSPKQIKRGVTMEGSYLNNVKILNPRRIDALETQIDLQGVNSIVVDPYGTTEKEETGTANTNINGYDYHVRRKTTNITGNINYYLQSQPFNAPVTFIVTGATIAIVPPTGKAIVPNYATGTVNYIQATVEGSSITLSPLADGNWKIDNMVGTWTAH